jgi:16S rRNA (guanine527-N7)-methyltransferase
VRVEIAKVEKAVGKFDVITARAVASLCELLRISQHLSTRKTVWALPKGRTGLTELAEARRAWQGVFHVEQSVTDENSYIVVGTGVGKKR